MTDVLPPLMFLTLVIFIFTGYPVAFSIGATALLFAFIGVQAGHFDWALLGALSERIFGIMSNYVLLAVVFFIFMGLILEKSRLAEDLLETIGMLFGPLRGGLALAVVFVGALLAAATGVVGASVVAMGLISLPVMLRHGYSTTLATGVIAASGTLGQIIPPSVVLIVLGDQLGVSVGELFMGAVVPGLILTGLYAIYVIVIAIIKPSAAPAIKRTGPLGRRVITVLIPPLTLVMIVLGSIIAGIATPTEAGALGSIGALILARFRGTLTRDVLTQAMDHTTKLTTMVLFLLIGSTAFALVFRGIYGDVWIEDIFNSLPGGAIGALVAAHLLIFILGFFIDFFEIAFIVIPLIAPVLANMGIDLVWFGVTVGVNLQMSFLTPPFGPALFYLRGVAPKEITTAQIYRGVIPFIVIQAICLILVLVFPRLIG